MLTFADLAIGVRFQKAGYTFTKRTEATAVDHNGGIATIGPDAWVEKLAAMPTFAGLAIGERFEKGGQLFQKHDNDAATDDFGCLHVFNPHATVGRLTQIATKPDILKRPEPSHETRITRLTITPTRFPLYCEEAFSVELVDEAELELVLVSQKHEGLVKIAPSEWPLLRRAIDRMIERCRKDHNEED